MENLQSIFSDPMYSTMASRAGLHPETYWQTLHPKAKEQHLSRVGAPPATYVTEGQYADSQAVGANSGPNAYLSNSPVLAGYDGNPIQPGYPGSGPRADAAPVLSSVADADVVRNVPGALSPMDQGQVPGPGTTDTYVPPANDLTAAALLKKQEGVLATENVGQRQKLETMIRDLEEGITSSDDLPRLEQLKAKLAELGGSPSENVSTPQYDTAAQDYARQLEDAQVMAVEARPTVNLARQEIENLLPLMDDPTVSEVIKAGVQSRIEDAQAVIAQSEADADAIRGVPAGAPGYTQPSSMETPGPVLSNPDVNDPRTPALMADGSAANRAVASSGGVLEDPTAAPPANAAILSQSNVANTTAAAAASNSTSKGSVGGGSGGGNRTTGSTTQSTSRSVSPSTGNARGSQMGYGKANNAEMLMRVGGAMYSGSLKGDGIGAATREYGQIQDDRRAADTAAYEQSEATRLKEAALRAAAARARASGAAKDKKGRASAGDLRVGMSKLGTALNLIRGSDGSLTGMNPSAFIDRFLGKIVGNDQEAQRLFLNEIGLDSIMKRVSETKGAISNAEMALFGRQVPDINSQEIVWERWLQRQMQMSEILLARAEGGTVVDPNAPLSETMPGLTGGSGGSTDYSAADALVGI